MFDDSGQARDWFDSIDRLEERLVSIGPVTSELEAFFR
jgi:hypothetical protein